MSEKVEDAEGQPPPPPPPPPPPRAEDKPDDAKVEKTAPKEAPRMVPGNRPRDSSLSPVQLDGNGRIRYPTGRIPNYGSMERPKRGENRNPHLERRLSYGYGQETDGRNPFVQVGTGSLERGKNSRYMERVPASGYSSMRRDKYPGNSPRMTDGTDGEGYGGLVNDLKRMDRSRFSPGKGDVPRGAYFQQENPRRSSYDFEWRQSDYPKAVLPDFGGDRRRLSQPANAGLPPPFYYPPPPPGKLIYCLKIFRSTCHGKIYAFTIIFAWILPLPPHRPSQTYLTVLRQTGRKS